MKSKLKIIGLLILAFSCFQNQCVSQCYYSQPTNFWAKGKSTGLADLDNVINNENILLQAVFGVKIDLYVSSKAKQTTWTQTTYRQKHIKEL